MSIFKKKLILVIGFLIFSNGLSVLADSREELKKEVDGLEKQVLLYEKIIENKQKQAKTLTNELSIIKNAISKKNLEIKRTNAKIKTLNLDIIDKESSIKESSERIEKTKLLLGGYLKELYKLDNTDDVFILLSSPQLSDFFENVKAVENLNDQLLDVLNKYKVLKSELEEEKDDFENQRHELLNLNSLLQVEKKNLSSENQQKNRLLKETKGEENKFQNILKDKKKDLAVLKSQLFYLEATGISAREALKYAEEAARKAGIRTSFLLAILEVETGRQFENGVLSVGSNLGTGHWKKDMYDCYLKLGKRTNAERQKQAYFKITSELNYDPDKMPVSRAPRYGCGGAIGPAQFLPSTWLSYKDRVANLLGVNNPDPWKINASFLGAALYLADLGADQKNISAEKAAAKGYLSGSTTCQKYICNLYANNVSNLTSIIDRNI